MTDRPKVHSRCETCGVPQWPGISTYQDDKGWPRHALEISGPTYPVFSIMEPPSLASAVIKL